MKKTDIQPLIELMATLRHPEKGCPWDLAQSHETLVTMTFEEMTELADAIVRDDQRNICEELGDVLFHLVFYARIAEENGDFSMQDLIDDVVNKMINRHPHIFEGKVYASDEEQKADWERIKAEEKAGKTVAYPQLDAKARLDSQPTIIQSMAMQKELAKLGFDWEKVDDVFAKIDEETSELRAELTDTEKDKANNIAKITEEYGDLLFAVMNLGRKLDIDPDMALRQANHKFYRRSEAMVNLGGGMTAFSQLSLDEKESLWTAIKQSK